MFPLTPGGLSLAAETGTAGWSAATSTLNLNAIFAICRLSASALLCDDTCLFVQSTDNSYNHEHSRADGTQHKLPAAGCLWFENLPL